MSEKDLIEIKAILQYLIDVEEFGYEDDNINSFSIWSNKAKKLLKKLNND